MKLTHFILGTLLGGISPFAYSAQQCNDAIPSIAPDERYQIHLDGTVTDLETGLMWQRCAQGQQWNGAECSGSDSTHTWSEALQQAEIANQQQDLGYQDWRLPNKKELASLVEKRCSEPAINLSVFPYIHYYWFWSSSPSVSYPDYAWYVSFNDGFTYIKSKSSGHVEGNRLVVRLVRAGQSFAFLPDTTPDAFSFNAQSNVVREAIVSSTETVTVSGINMPTPISVTIGEYAINDGDWQSADAEVKPGDRVRLRHTSAADFNQSIDQTLTIGGRSGIFRSTTEKADVSPDEFGFNGQSNVAQNALITSNTRAISGINSPATVTINNGEYRINNGAWQTIVGTIESGDTVAVRHVSADKFSQSVTTTLNIGDGSGSFTSTTAGFVTDSEPDNFSFSAHKEVERNTEIISDPITVSGINTAASISVSNGQYQINSGAWSSGNSTVNNGDSVRLKHTSSSNYNTGVTTALSIGGVSGSFTSTTVALAEDRQPDNFSFSAQQNVARSTQIVSNAITVSGINVAVNISINNGEYQINNGAWRTTAATVNNGDTVRVRHNAAADYHRSVTSTLTISGLSRSFTSTTLEQPQPGQYGFIKGDVFNACNGQPLPFTDIKFNAERIQQSDKNGEYEIRLPGGTYDVEVNLAGYQLDRQAKTIKSGTLFATFPLVPEQGCGIEQHRASSYKAIIVSAGGATIGSRPNFIWSDSQKLSDKAYDALKLQGYGDQNIYYMSADGNERDADNDGLNDIDAKTSLENLQYAITEWAGGVEDVVIYLIGHGGQQTLNLTRESLLTAGQLNGWLDILQENITGKLSVVIDACYSASFINALAAPDRYILTSAESDSLAVIANQGLTSFSYYFWDEVVFSGRLGFAFSSARQAMSRQAVGGGKKQKGVLDTDGDRIETQKDYDLIEEYCYGLCNSKASTNPDIERVVSPDTLSGEISSELSLQLTPSSNEASAAWMTIQRPDYIYPADGSALNSLPQVALNCNGRQCSGQYDNFNVNGEYRLTFYAEDEKGNVSLPRSVKVLQSGRDNREWDASAVYEPVTGRLSLKEVDVFGQFYYVELLNKGDYQFGLSYAQPIADTITYRNTGFDGKKVTVPSVLAFGNYYTIELLPVEGGLFQLDFDSIGAAGE